MIGVCQASGGRQSGGAATQAGQRGGIVGVTWGFLEQRLLAWRSAAPCGARALVAGALWLQSRASRRRVAQIAGKSVPGGSNRAQVVPGWLQIGPKPAKLRLARDLDYKRAGESVAACSDRAQMTNWCASAQPGACDRARRCVRSASLSSGAPRRISRGVVLRTIHPVAANRLSRR